MALGNRFNVQTAQTEATLKKLFGDGTPEERLTRLGMREYLPYYDRPNGYKPSMFIPRVNVKDAADDGSVMICIGTPAGFICKFYIQSYPACCGIMMLYNFATNPQIKQEDLDEILSAFFSENDYGKGSHLLGRSNRLEVVMVESGSRKAIRAVEEVEPTKEPYINYQNLYNFFKKYAVVREQLEYNENSRNTLHIMQVVFPHTS
jgi:hypothetical protein